MASYPDILATLAKLGGWDPCRNLRELVEHWIDSGREVHKSLAIDDLRYWMARSVRLDEELESFRWFAKRWRWKESNARSLFEEIGLLKRRQYQPRRSEPEVGDEEAADTARHSATQRDTADGENESESTGIDTARHNATQRDTAHTIERARDRLHTPDEDEERGGERPEARTPARDIDVFGVESGPPETAEEPEVEPASTGGPVEPEESRTSGHPDPSRSEAGGRSGGKGLGGAAAPAAAEHSGLQDWSAETRPILDEWLRWMDHPPSRAMRETIRLLLLPRDWPIGATIPRHPYIGRQFNGYSVGDIVSAIERFATSAHNAPYVLVKHVAGLIDEELQQQERQRNGKAGHTSGPTRGSPAGRRPSTAGDIQDVVERELRRTTGEPHGGAASGATGWPDEGAPGRVSSRGCLGPAGPE